MTCRFRASTTAMLMGLVVACSSAACSSSSSGNGTSPPNDSGAPAEFVAFMTDFQGFCNWPQAPAAPSGDDASDGIHGLGPLRVFWNKNPPSGAHEFPVGTIIVKESQQANVADRVVFAMVKRQARGTGFNSMGADGWEWFSLTDTGCATTQLWRGIAPLGTESYAMTPGGDCNGCHSQVVDNDYVWDEPLQLSKF